jgi:hypothetical protein
MATKLRPIREFFSLFQKKDLSIVPIAAGISFLKKARIAPINIKVYASSIDLRSEP